MTEQLLRPWNVLVYPNAGGACFSMPNSSLALLVLIGNL